MCEKCLKFLKFQINGGKPSDEYIVDLKRLRLWLREMEKQLSQFPTISDAIKMKDFELERLQKKNEVSWFPPFSNLFLTQCAVISVRNGLQCKEKNLKNVANILNLMD